MSRLVGSDSVIDTTSSASHVGPNTDATAFVGGEVGYSNWELSNDRANAARRALVANGLDPTRVMRVVGLADTVLLDKKKPHNPQNRRISIVVMNRDTEESISAGEGEAPPPAGDETPAEPAADAPAADAPADAAATPAAYAGGAGAT